MWSGVLEQYRQWLPLSDNEQIVTLYEGNTPLVPAPALAAGLLSQAPLRLYLKFDGANPTGSFKDRGMTLAVTKAVAAGARVLLCASTGNTSAAAAAYAAAAGIEAAVLLPHGGVAAGKLAQAIAYGARLITIDGTFDQALAIVTELAAGRPAVALVNSVNPFRIQGQMTAAFEITDQLAAFGEAAPAVLALPVGNAGNITAYWYGFQKLKEAGRIHQLPQLLGFQAEGSAPLVSGHPVEHPETVASAIRIGNPASGPTAQAAVNDTGGRFTAVSDQNILSAQRQIAAATGIFCEPASAASVAGLIKLAEQGYFDAHPPCGPVVCVLTGHGLKDPQAVMNVALPDPLPPDPQQVVKQLF